MLVPWRYPWYFPKISTFPARETAETSSDGDLLGGLEALGDRNASVARCDWFRRFCERGSQFRSGKKYRKCGVNDVQLIWKCWWLGHPSEKCEFVNWDGEIPNISGKIKHVPNHQPVKYWLLWIKLKRKCSKILSRNGWSKWWFSVTTLNDHLFG